MAASRAASAAGAGGGRRMTRLFVGQLAGRALRVRLDAGMVVVEVGDADLDERHRSFVNRMVTRGYTEKQVRRLVDWYLHFKKSAQS